MTEDEIIPRGGGPIALFPAVGLGVADVARGYDGRPRGVGGRGSAVRKAVRRARERGRYQNVWLHLWFFPLAYIIPCLVRSA